MQVLLVAVEVLMPAEMSRCDLCQLMLMMLGGSRYVNRLSKCMKFSKSIPVGCLSDFFPVLAVVLAAVVLPTV